MSKNLPPKVAKQIKALVYKKADKFKYLAKSRPENNRFIENLLSDPEIGGKLSTFMRKERIKTYIKDGILNRYSKNKTQAARLEDPRAVIEKKLGFRTKEVESDPMKKVALFKSIGRKTQDQYVVVAEGTYVKWETALKKALMYSQGKPFTEKSDTSIHILLCIFAQDKKIPPSDKKALEKALKRYKTHVYVHGEG